MASFVQELYDQILKHVKNSNLNFVIAETPFSLDIKIKKKFVRTFSAPAKTFQPSDHFNSNSEVTKSPQSFSMDPINLASSQSVDSTNNNKPTDYAPTLNMSNTLFTNPISTSSKLPMTGTTPTLPTDYTRTLQMPMLSQNSSKNQLKNYINTSNLPSTLFMHSTSLHL